MENTFDWNKKRIKFIIDHYGYKFFYGKKVADLGCGYAEIGGALYRLGADVMAIDARQEHLKIVNKKFPGMKTVRANLDEPWPFFGQKFDVILDLGLLCHLANFESHLKAVCTSTTHLILETAVCDSNDTNKCAKIIEAKSCYDLSYNGMGCRPSTLAIENLLQECGMEFKRIENANINSGEYKYNWYPENDNSDNLNKRRLWIATKKYADVNLSELTSTSKNEYTMPIVNSGIPLTLTVSPKPPMSERIKALSDVRQSQMNILRVPEVNKVEESVPEVNTTAGYSELTSNAPHDQVKKNSKEFALISADTFTVERTLDLSGIIFPNSYGSRMWLKKIIPLFPNIKVSNKTINMNNVNKSSDAINVIMCTLDNLVPYRRVWIEEWPVGKLTSKHIEILKSCQNIMTPSLLNAQEILQHLPNVQIQRICRPWPLINVQPTKTGHFIYFEKNTEATDLLLKNWNNNMGKLIIVGSDRKVSDFVELILDTANYQSIIELLMGAQALIDISENNYYLSGILKLANKLSLPIISNNITEMNSAIIIDQDKTSHKLPSIEQIHKAIDTFINSEKTTAKFNPDYNNEINVDIKTMLGI